MIILIRECAYRLIDLIPFFLLSGFCPTFLSLLFLKQLLLVCGVLLWVPYLLQFLETHLLALVADYVGGIVREVRVLVQVILPRLVGHFCRWLLLLHDASCRLGFLGFHFFFLLEVKLEVLACSLDIKRGDDL